MNSNNVNIKNIMDIMSSKQRRLVESQVKLFCHYIRRLTFTPCALDLNAEPAITNRQSLTIQKDMDYHTLRIQKGS